MRQLKTCIGAAVSPNEVAKFAPKYEDPYNAVEIIGAIFKILKDGKVHVGNIDQVRGTMIGGSLQS